MKEVNQSVNQSISIRLINQDQQRSMRRQQRSSNLGHFINIKVRVSTDKGEEERIQDAHHWRSQPGCRARLPRGFGKASARLIGMLVNLADKKMSGNSSTPWKNLSPYYDQLFFAEYAWRFYIFASKTTKKTNNDKLNLNASILEEIFYLMSSISVSTCSILCPDVHSKITVVPWRKTKLKKKCKVTLDEFMI